MQFSKFGFLLSVFALSASIGCGGGDSAGKDLDADLMSELLGPEVESDDSSHAKPPWKAMSQNRTLVTCGLSAIHQSERHRQETLQDLSVKSWNCDCSRVIVFRW